MSSAVSEIESAQYRPFKGAVEINVYATVDSFSSHSGADPRVRGASFNGSVHLSPLRDDRPQTLPLIVIHELSHLHLQQYIGTIAWNRNIPVWFQEGLAVMVSGGGGAEKVTDADASRAIRQGKRFTPGTQGRLFIYEGASHFGLEHQMFYRQAGLFASYLRRSDPPAFRSLVLALTEKVPFDAAFTRAYMRPMSGVWSAFVGGLQAAAALQGGASRASA